MIRNAGKSKRVTEDTNIGIAVRNDTVEIERSASNCRKGCAECEVVDGIAATQQGPVDVEKVGIVPIPEMWS
jgi:hypothetical protein